MEYLSTTIVVYWIIAILIWLATMAFIILDKNKKEAYFWLWVALAFITGPIALLPYWFWGRER